MIIDDIRKKARCGACRGKIGRQINLVSLRRKATWEHPTCGNILTGEDKMAVAVLCDRCIESNAEIREALEFTDGAAIYHPIEGLEQA